MEIRRIITGNDKKGASVKQGDGQSPKAMNLEHTPGFVSSPLWSTGSVPQIPYDEMDPMETMTTMLPAPGETRFMVITFPPDSVMMSPDFKPELAGPEHALAAPGIAETFEMDSPGMHTTPTVDYVVVMEGEIWLELDNEEAIHLKTHDTLIQNGVRHAWRNKGDKPATISVVMVGAQQN